MKNRVFSNPWALLLALASASCGERPPGSTVPGSTSEGMASSVGSGSSGGGSSGPSADETGAPACEQAPRFELVPGRGSFTKRVDVFGVPVFATAPTDDVKVLHAAHVLAQYLDNDEDCVVDEPDVLAAMIDGGAAIIMAPTEDDLPFEIEGQPLFGDETHPTGAAEGRFDATLEEVLHLVTSLGYARAYPDMFGEGPGTALTDAMDIARGGHFLRIPRVYPEQAWYHYDDWTCDYRCMAAEYVYWALTTWLGAQSFPGRCEDIAVEWELCTPQDLEAVDTAVHALLTDPRVHLPTVLPDGSYRVAP